MCQESQCGDGMANSWNLQESSSLLKIPLFHFLLLINTPVFNYLEYLSLFTQVKTIIEKKNISLLWNRRNLLKSEVKGLFIPSTKFTRRVNKSTAFSKSTVWKRSKRKKLNKTKLKLHFTQHKDHYGHNNQPNHQEKKLRPGQARWHSRSASHPS